MKILALDSDSSSIKYRLFDSSKHYQQLKQGLAERIGQKTSSICHIIENQPACQEEIELPDFRTAMHATMDYKAFLYGLPLEYYEKHKIRKYGFHGINHAYIVALNGVDAIVFTGEIGEKSSYIHALIAKNFSYLGVSASREEDEKNKTIFSTRDSRISLMTIPANEELLIAQQTSQALTEH